MGRTLPLPAVEGLAANILVVLGRAKPEHHREGIDWYQHAHTLARVLAGQHGITVDQAAGVLAALSPQLSWPRNVAYAEQFLATGDAPVLGRSKRAAARIVAGEAPLSVPSGPKVRAFFSNIADPDGLDAVTVDRHAHDVAVGQRYGDARRPLLGRQGGYELLASAFRLAAAKVGLHPSAVQAITWLAWRAA
jgi:hypothetical protein